MKKSNLIIISVILLAVLFVVVFVLCLSNQKNNTNSDEPQSSIEQVGKKDTRELIWEKLPSEQKERVDGTWKDGRLSKVILDKNAVGWIDDKSYEGKEVYLIDFPTRNTGIPNNMLIYADVDTFEYIGNAPLD